HHLRNDVAQQKGRVRPWRDYLYADPVRYPATAIRLMFTSNHDENSWSGSEFARMGDAVQVMAALTFVLPQGMPLIYTGQEVGCDHTFEFFDRDPIADYTPNYYTAFYRRLCRMKHSNAALRAGERGGRMIEIENNAKDCMLSFVREVEGNRVVVLANVSPYTIHADFYTGIYAGTYVDAMTGVESELPSHVERDMAPWSFQILTK
ncbi:MAG: alpha-amylase, partial [Alistipes sp.]|nr:alpha-amylase [Alistipes sp.]